MGRPIMWSEIKSRSRKLKNISFDIHFSWLTYHYLQRDNHRLESIVRLSDQKSQSLIHMSNASHRRQMAIDDMTLNSRRPHEETLMMVLFGSWLHWILKNALVSFKVYHFELTSDILVWHWLRSKAGFQTKKPCMHQPGSRKVIDQHLTICSLGLCSSENLMFINYESRLCYIAYYSL